MISSVDGWTYDIMNFLTDVEYFQILLYDPLKLYGNIEAAYEYCTFNTYTEQLELLTSLDYGYMAEVVVRDGLLFALEFQTYWDDYLVYLDNDDMYDAGIKFGEFWSLVFDSTIQM